MDGIGFSTGPAGVDPSSSSALLQDLETKCKYSMDHNPSLGHTVLSDLPTSFDLDAYADQALNEMQCDLQPPFTSTDHTDYGMGNLSMAGLGPQAGSSSIPLVRTTLPMPTGSSYIIQKPSTGDVQKALDTSHLAGISHAANLLPEGQHYSTSSHAFIRPQGTPEALHAAPIVSLPSPSISMAATTNLASIANINLHGSNALSTSLDATSPRAMSVMFDTVELNQQLHTSSQETAGPPTSAAIVPVVSTSTVSMATQTLPSIGSIMTTSACSSHENKLPGLRMPGSNISVTLAELATLNPGSTTTLSNLPVTLKPNAGSLPKGQDVMVYRDKVTGKYFLIPVGPAQPSSGNTVKVDKDQEAEPVAHGPRGTQGPWNQDAYGLPDLNVSKYLNIQTSASMGVVSSAYIAASSSSATSHVLPQTAGPSSRVELNSSEKTGPPEARPMESKDKAAEKPTSSQDSVNTLKSHLLRFIADGCSVDAAAKQGADPGQTDGDGAERSDGPFCQANGNAHEGHGKLEGDEVDKSSDERTCASVRADFRRIETPTDTTTNLLTKKVQRSESKYTAGDENTTKDSVDATEAEGMKHAETSVPAPATPVLSRAATGSTGDLMVSAALPQPRYTAVMAVVNVQKMSSCGLVPALGKRDFVVQIDDSQCVLEDGKRVWKCLLCPKQYATKHNLTQHILSHMEVKPHSCSTCGKSFRQQSHLHTHMLTHTNIKPYSCSECRRGFTQASHLKRHMATHMQQRPHVCNACGRGFAFPSELKCHMDRHNNGQENMCDTCQETFETPRKLKMHKATAHKDTEPLTCKECGKVCTFPSQLRDHMMRHEGKRPYTCSKCGMCFMKEHHLKAHHLTHSGLRPYVCDVCDRAFTQRANLQRHQLIHSAERKYKCEICGKAFTQPQVLKSHMTTHADCKPFKCKYCDKRFARMHNLIGHEAAHNGTKPHTCFCGSSFTLKGNLNRHKKVKHGMEVNVDCTEEEAAQILNQLSKPRICEQDIQDIDISKDSSSPLVKKRRKSLPHRKIPIAEREDHKIWTMWQGGEASDDAEEEDGGETKESDDNEGNVSGSEVIGDSTKSDSAAGVARHGEAGEDKMELEFKSCADSAEQETQRRERKSTKNSQLTTSPSSAIQRRKESGIFGKTY